MTAISQDIFKYIFLEEYFGISLQIWLKFVSGNGLASVQ